MTDYENRADQWDNHGQGQEKFPFLPVAAVVLAVMVGLALFLQVKRKQDRVRGFPPSEHNVYYNGYKRSDYPGVQGNHEAVQNGFDVGNGLFGRCTNTRIRDITDGTSNTMMVGERHLCLNHGAIWMRSINRDGTGEDARAIVGVCSEKHPLNVHFDPHAFGSSHEGGAHFLLGDGAVRFVQENIDIDIYGNLAQRNDGNIIPPF